LDGKPFDNDDLDLFSTFCRQVAMAIENTRMHKLQMEQQRLQHELESAKIIQESFMPEILPDLVNSQFSIAAKSLPAAMVGGDLYDFIQFDSHTLGIAVGDVTGKGVPAALYMARLVSDFRQHAQRSRLPSAVFKSLNRLLVERSRRGMFVTMQYGILNSEDGKFMYSNAGHIPYIKMSSKRKIELLSGAKTIPLGIAPELEFEETSVQLKKGDFLVSITDGIIEAKNSAGEEYSLNRTLELLSKSKGTAEEIVESLIKDVQVFAKGTDQHDDLTVLAMHWN
ncbi:PP2C family protein-serine/threonine phosphatase, partial [candidate division KSB1 bacterium]|nr:PP2C family protein-serine/threonine phosphatase [candidate division KSB1 bacterium]